MTSRSRSAELREKNRRVFAWSLGLAALIHIAVFVLWPGFRVEPLAGSGGQDQAVSEAEGGLTFVDVFFGPPDIFEVDGMLSREPPDRVLEADRVLQLPTECATLGQEGRTPAYGRVRVRVRPSGRADVVGIAESTGDECGDEVIRTVAGDLLYHWLPSERFPAPVDLIQPVTLTQAWN
jgi:hypothetical protein